jgi:nucleotide-binding universal stress UspA family protein
MRSILLHVHEDAGMEARLQVSLDLARAFDAHLTCFQPVDVDYALPGDLYGTMITELLPVIQENAARLRDRLSARLVNEDVIFDWVQENGPARPLLQRAGALADLVVLGARDPGNSGKGPSSLAGHVAVHGLGPVLVVPETSRSLDVEGTAAIGWNGSLEAAHALRSAVPLLRKASSVILVNVTEAIDDPGAFLPCLEGAEYLSRHGISCEILEIGLREDTVGEALASAAMARGASVLAIGAYGHRRVVETMFGGVTHELLADPPLALFTAH